MRRAKRPKAAKVQSCQVGPGFLRRAGACERLTQIFSHSASVGLNLADTGSAQVSHGGGEDVFHHPRQAAQCALAADVARRHDDEDSLPRLRHPELAATGLAENWPSDKQGVCG